MSAAPMIELWRGGRLESWHSGHAVICDARGDIVEAWGDPQVLMYPRSSCKMVQALPLVESGAADRAGLGEAELALACASHQGAEIHTTGVLTWLKSIGMGESALRCGVQMPGDEVARDALYRYHGRPCQLHNNCSGKHAGFLTLMRETGGGPEYVEPDHPVQRAVRQAIEEVAEETSPGYGIDGCSAPNYALTLAGLGRSMSFFAGATEDGSARERAAFRLARAMAARPELVAGERRACTNLMRAMGGTAVVKTGAEAVFVAILPDLGRSIALKITDGATRASEAAITALLVRVGALPADHPLVDRYIPSAQKNWRGIVTGDMRLAPGFG